MTPAKDPYDFLKRVKNTRKENLEAQGIYPKSRKKEMLRRKELLQQHLKRQPEVIRKLSERAKLLASGRKEIFDSISGMPIGVIDEFKTHFAKYNDAYSDFLGATKKDRLGHTELETLELFLENASKVSDLRNKEQLIRHYEERRLLFESKLTTLENAEEKLIKVLMKK